MVVQACDGGWARKIASLKKKKELIGTWKSFYYTLTFTKNILELRVASARSRGFGFDLQIMAKNNNDNTWRMITSNHNHGLDHHKKLTVVKVG
jgi:hypothetical protein